MNVSVDSKQGRTALDARLAVFQHLDRGMPRSGWVRAVRDALGMTTRQMGQRLGVSAAAVSQLEKSERQGTIQLDTLRRAADALDCSLFYVLVPRNSLEATLSGAALKKATELKHSFLVQRKQRRNRHKVYFLRRKFKGASRSLFFFMNCPCLETK